MSLNSELEQLLNHHSAENASNTPDFILAKYLSTCLDAFNTATRNRDTWFGISPRPGWHTKVDGVDG